MLTDKDKTYRVEWTMTRTDASVRTCTCELFDESVSLTVPVFDSTDFTEFSTPANTLANQTLDYTDADACFRRFMVGSSGQSGATFAATGIIFGGIAFSKDAAISIGPYPAPGSGEGA